MQITTMLTNRMCNPLGVELGAVPRLSWVIETKGNEKAGPIPAARVQVALDSGFNTVLWDSGFREDLDRVACPVQIALKSRTRYYWRVSLQTITSETAWFETAKLEEPWVAHWISPDFDPAWHPELFSSFSVNKEVNTARCYICGLGLYRLSINGEKAGDEQLAPGLCAYDKWIPYQTYDVTALLLNGENSLQVALGNGWYKGRYGISSKREFHHGGEFACIAELHITYKDGSTELNYTNTETWKARRSAIINSSIFDGEYRDDTLDTEKVYPVKSITIRPALPIARRAQGIKIMQRLKPKAVIKTPAGETVLDMGQNMVGWLEFKNRSERGSEIYLQFGEVLQGGNFYRDNLRSALAEYKYTSDGEEKTVCPRFTFYGFRYVKLTKWPGTVDINDFTGLVLYSDMRQT